MLKDHMISKETANYTETPKPWQGKCKDCTMFRQGNVCTLVRGGIKRSAHCDHFDRKS